MVRHQLRWLGEDPAREGLQETPRRMLAAWQEMTAGYREHPEAYLTVTFHEPCDELIMVKGIGFVSLCEHHLLPFTGRVTVGYVPADNRVVGLSKIPRAVQALARRLQTQERLTTQIADVLQRTLEPLGVGVLMEAKHSCMQLRGVKSRGRMITSCLLGVLRDDTRQEFLALARAS